MLFANQGFWSFVECKICGIGASSNLVERMKHDKCQRRQSGLKTGGGRVVDACLIPEVSWGPQSSIDGGM